LAGGQGFEPQLPDPEKPPKLAGKRLTPGAIGAISL